MIKISLSFSGKQHTGSRIPRREHDGDLKEETPEEFVRRERKRKRKARRNLAIPYEDSTSPEQMRVSKENWLGRMERPVKKRRSIGIPR